MRLAVEADRQPPETQREGPFGLGRLDRRGATRDPFLVTQRLGATHHHSARDHPILEQLDLEAYSRSRQRVLQVAERDFTRELDRVAHAGPEQVVLSAGEHDECESCRGHEAVPFALSCKHQRSTSGSSQNGEGRARRAISVPLDVVKLTDSPQVLAHDSARAAHRPRLCSRGQNAHVKRPGIFCRKQNSFAICRILQNAVPDG